MLMIRLQRVGRKNEPSFRVVVTESQNGPKSGRSLEVVGSYDPREGKGNNALNKERILHWISKGAQTSETMHNMLVSQKIISGKKVNPLPKKKPIVKDAPKEEAKAPAAPVVEAPKA